MINWVFSHKKDGCCIALFFFLFIGIAFAQKPGTHETPTIGKEYHPSGAKGGVMVYVPAGEFMMGCSPSDSQCEFDENPAHSVYLDEYYIDKYEVSQGEYNACVSAGQCRPNEKYDGFTGDRQPVVGVSWNDAKIYCEWSGKRLPTEAEWEKAARGADGRIYPWGNEKASCSHAVMDDGGEGCGRKATLPVGSKLSNASPYGALDMAGNAWEWVSDWYDEKYYSNSPARNPKGPSSEQYRILRGGSWFNVPSSLRLSKRSYYTPGLRYSYYGFRCSMNP